jgi:hypothetical protein
VGIVPILLAAGAAVAAGRGDAAAQIGERSVPHGTGVLASLIVMATALVILGAVALAVLDVGSDA